MRWISARAAVRALVAAVVLATASVSGVLAHEGRESAGYHLVVGFLHEPAYEGYLNAAYLEVSRQKGPQGADEAKDHSAASEPVTGLEDTLQVAVTHISSGQSTVMALAPLFEHPGAYTADFIPTQPGGYRFRFFGSIEGRLLDEVFESGTNTFDAVQSRAVAQFPVALPSVRELEGVVRNAQASSDEALDAVAGARVIGIVGAVVGAIGLATAVGAMALVIRSRRA